MTSSFQKLALGSVASDADIQRFKNHPEMVSTADIVKLFAKKARERSSKKVIFPSAKNALPAVEHTGIATATLTTTLSTKAPLTATAHTNTTNPHTKATTAPCPKVSKPIANETLGTAKWLNPASFSDLCPPWRSTSTRTTASSHSVAEEDIQEDQNLVSLFLGDDSDRIVDDKQQQIQARRRSSTASYSARKATRFLRFRRSSANRRQSSPGATAFSDNSNGSSHPSATSSQYSGRGSIRFSAVYRHNAKLYSEEEEDLLVGFPGSADLTSASFEEEETSLGDLAEFDEHNTLDDSEESLGEAFVKPSNWIDYDDDESDDDESNIHPSVLEYLKSSSIIVEEEVTDNKSSGERSFRHLRNLSDLEELTKQESFKLKSTRTSVISRASMHSSCGDIGGGGRPTDWFTQKRQPSALELFELENDSDGMQVSLEVDDTVEQTIILIRSQRKKKAKKASFIKRMSRSASC